MKNKKTTPPNSLAALPETLFGVLPLKTILIFIGLLPLWPLLFLLFANQQTASDDNVLTDIDFAIIMPYLTTTFYMVMTTGILAVIFGISLAWFFEFFTFPAKKLLSWLVLTPFALPPYIAAMVYIEQLSPEGFLASYLTPLIGFFNPRDWRLASMVMALSLYPYVYLLARSFLSSSLHITSSLEMARVLGFSMQKCFWFLFLPLMIPQMMTGFILVGLEVMADYGAMSFFAVRTLSIGMFDLWLNLGQINYARYFCVVIFLLVFLLLALNYFSQNFHFIGWRLRRKYNIPSGKPTLYRRPIALSPMAVVGLFSYLLPLLFFAFGLPCLSLLFWFLAPLWQTDGLFHITAWLDGISQTLPAMGTSFLLSSLAALGMMLFAITIGFAERQWRIYWLKVPLVLGYAMPGVILAFGVLTIGFYIIGFFSHDNDKWRDSGYYNIIMVGLLFYGYLAKFSASFFIAVASGYRAISMNIDNAARVLGERPIKLFGNMVSGFVYQTRSAKKNWHKDIIGGVLGLIHLPLLRPALLAGFLITFIEIIKELPITLVLRPFGVETLALRLFTLVSDERIHLAALPAMLIVLVSMVSIWLTKKYWLQVRD
ncbi:MAG: ABC transporter permease [Alphaproteobacteria bacterium]